jgi:hypothetical protein
MTGSVGARASKETLQLSGARLGLCRRGLFGGGGAGRHSCAIREEEEAAAGAAFVHGALRRAELTDANSGNVSL